MLLLLPDRERIETASLEIFKLFSRQCTNGAQSRQLAPYDAAACGQFIGQSALPLKQRGLYGTASAIRVIGSYNNTEAVALMRQLINYVRNRRDIETQLAPNDSVRQRILAKCDRDDLNVIKQSELLYALTLIRGVNPTDDLKNDISARLVGAIKPHGGWSYFTDDPASSWEPLPTAYAIRALKAYGYNFDADSSPDLLFKGLKNSLSSKGSNNWDISVPFLAIHALHTVGKGEDELKKYLVHAWKMAESLLSQDLEQNIEYWRSDETFYVRVPWQLHLLALASQLAPYRIFPTAAAQRRLKAALDAVLDSGFRYPHSGSMLSARTNAILHDVLQTVRSSLKPLPLYQPLYIYDRVRDIFSSRVVALLGAAVGLSVAGVSIREWVRRSDRSVSDLAPELLGAICLFLISILRKARSR